MGQHAYIWDKGHFKRLEIDADISAGLKSGGYMD